MYITLDNPEQINEDNFFRVIMESVPPENRHSFVVGDMLKLVVWFFHGEMRRFVHTDIKGNVVNKVDVYPGPSYMCKNWIRWENNMDIPASALISGF